MKIIVVGESRKKCQNNMNLNVVLESEKTEKIKTKTKTKSKRELGKKNVQSNMRSVRGLIT